MGTSLEQIDRRYGTYCRTRSMGARTAIDIELNKIADGAPDGAAVDV
jgi:hypothetical protein